MVEKISSKVIQQIYSLCEGFVQDKIKTARDNETKKEWEEVFEKAKIVFKGRLPYVNWFFEHTFDSNIVVTSQRLLKEFEHFYNYGIPKIDNFPIVNYSLQEVMDKFKSIEKEFQEGNKRVIPASKISDNVEVLMECSNSNFVWFDLNTTSSNQESDYMGHCGRDNCDTLFSLREKKFIGNKHYGWEPHVTASFHEEDQRLSQVKGRENNKPVEKYHKYILELFEKGTVKDFGGGSYKSENDFGWIDVSSEYKQELVDKGIIPENLFLNILLETDNPEEFAKKCKDLGFTYNISDILSDACEKGNEDVVEALLKTGISNSDKMIDLDALAMWSMEDDQWGVLNVLMNYGAKNPKDFDYFVAREGGRNWFSELVGDGFDLYDFVYRYGDVEDLEKKLYNPIDRELSLKMAQEYLPRNWMERRFGEDWDWDSIAVGFAEEFFNNYGEENPFVWEEIMEYYEDELIKEDEHRILKGKYDPKYPMSVYKSYRRYEGYLHSMEEIDEVEEDKVISRVSDATGADEEELKAKIEEWRSLGEEKTDEDIDI